ncbi:MAG: alpha/beta hydrolase [Burkholderiales bacterium]|nr:alpha/beta hydrolase [Burkholderiales bacterium]
MNNQQRKSDSLLVRALGWIILMAFCNTAAAIESSVKADNATTPNIECLLNWAQTFYPNLFSPAVQGVQFSSPYTYRYYPITNSYVGVSSTDNHVYYLGPDDVLPKDMGDFSDFMKEAGCGTRPYPVIFIHGIASSADTWAAYRDYLTNNAGWTFGGVPAYDQNTKTVNISCPSDSSQLAGCTGSAGDFYTLNFSDNQGLSLDVQGGELAVIIKAILDENPGTTNVLLIGHSTGGLAARQYLQGLARLLDSEATIPYREDVAKLITIGTPHQGSFWAEVCHTGFDIFDIFDNVGICDLLPLDINQNSIAIKELQPDSSALNILNDLTTYPLPPNVAYVSIIVTGQPTLASLVDFQDGDGIVSDISQNLITVTGNLPLQQKSTRIDILFRECGNKIKVPVIGDVGQVHTCETTDIDVGSEILRDLH